MSIKSVSSKNLAYNLPQSYPHLHSRAQRGRRANPSSANVDHRRTTSAHIEAVVEHLQIVPLARLGVEDERHVRRRFLRPAHHHLWRLAVFVALLVRSSRTDADGDKRIG